MPKEPVTTEEKLADAKKASKSANKKQKAKKVNAAAKKLAEKTVIEMAADMPAAKGNAFITEFNNYVKAVGQCRAAAKLKGSVRSKLKSFKVDMKAFDRVFKLYEMDEGDVAALKATEALYEQQVGMKLSPEQKAIVGAIETKRENNRAAMATVTGNEIGKSVGSTEPPIGHNSAQAANEGAAMPERNEAVVAGLRPVEAVAQKAH